MCALFWTPNKMKSAELKFVTVVFVFASMSVVLLELALHYKGDKMSDNEYDIGMFLRNLMWCVNFVVTLCTLVTVTGDIKRHEKYNGDIFDKIA